MGENADQEDVAYLLERISGILNDGAYATSTTNSKDGLVTTNLYVLQLSSSQAVKNAYYGVLGTTAALNQRPSPSYTNLAAAYNADAAMKVAASFVKQRLGSLTETTSNANTASGQTYFDYDYTGKASMVAVKTSDGDTNYFVAFAVTQTCTEKTMG